jgi:hypothetical protein
MLCETCKDSDFPGMVLTEVTFPRFRGDGYSTSWVLCPDCIGGIASCCDAAGSSSPKLKDTDD